MCTSLATVCAEICESTVVIDFIVAQVRVLLSHATTHYLQWSQLGTAVHGENNILTQDCKFRLLAIFMCCESISENLAS